MRRVLIITYYWPPSGGSGVQRWLKFAKYLPQNGWKPVIYTPLNPQANSCDNALLKDVSPSAEVIKRKIIEPYGLYKAITGKDSSKPIKANIISNSENKSLLHKLSVFIRGNVFIPDPRCLWINPSVRYLKKYLKENPVDVIVSTGPPHSMHLIAKKLSKEASVPWVADFRDPWTEIFYFKHLKLSRAAYKRHRMLEQSVLDNATAVTVVSNKMQRDFACRTATDIEVITNGFDADDFPAFNTCENTQKQEKKDEVTGKFRIVHTGILVENGNPNVLWEVLGEKAAKDALFRENLEIRTMGQTDLSIISDIEKNSLSPNFVDMGYVAHNIATMWQQRASLLLLPLRKEPEAAAILTGKFFEYLAAARPILAFGPTDGDLAKALQESESGVICEWEQKEVIREVIDKVYDRYLNDIQTNTLSCGKVPSEAALKYSRKVLTGKLADLLNRILAGSRDRQ